MAHSEKWIEERLNSLAPPAGWEPDAAAALIKVRERNRNFRRHRTQWLWSGMAAALVCLGIFLTPAKCAFGVCRTPAPAPSPTEPAKPAGPQEVRIQTPARAQVQAPKNAAAAPAPSPAPQVPVARDFKESGNPQAPVTLELFTDYQCPHCATVFDQVVPMLRAEYVQTGKVRFVHRDYPLPTHAYARLAARYANAAGTLGQYEVAVNQIFRTQPVWAQTGDVDSVLAQVLEPGLMDRIRDQVKNDGHLDDTVAFDVAIARQDNLNQTPTLVATHNGKRQVLAPIPPYGLLKNYLDDLLTK